MKNLTRIALAFCFVVTALACGALQSITPADRASAYKVHAKTIDTLCAAYTFDRSMGLVGDVPEMARQCGEALK